MANATVAAPWRELFLEHVSAMSLPLFTLSTLHHAQQQKPTAAASPRARTCIQRGLWGDLPKNHRNPAPLNPRVYESDMPVLTTDVRMAKAAELDTSGGGGGGPVEATWWCEGSGTQWRVRGTAWMLGPDIEEEAGRAAREALLPRMRSLEQADGEAGRKPKWSWAKEVTAHFGNLSPDMRSKFRNPPPGTPVAIPPGEGLGLGMKVEDLHDAIARANFRVVVIVPNEVDQADLSDPARARRWLYTYRGEADGAVQPGGEVVGGWEKVEVWP